MPQRGTPQRVLDAILEKINEELGDGNWRVLAVTRNYGWPGRLVAEEQLRIGHLERRGSMYRLTPVSGLSSLPVPTDHSLRSAILRRISDVQGDSPSLTAALHREGYSVSLHDVQHVVQSLGRQGVVRYDEKKNGSTKKLDNIRLADVATNPRIDLEPLAVVDDRVDHPLLDRLRSRKRLVNEAAEALEQAGFDDEALRLYNMPIENSPIEEEYLRFASRYET